MKTFNGNDIHSAVAHVNMICFLRRERCKSVLLLVVKSEVFVCAAISYINKFFKMKKVLMMMQVLLLAINAVAAKFVNYNDQPRAHAIPNHHRRPELYEPITE